MMEPVIKSMICLMQILDKKGGRGSAMAVAMMLLATGQGIGQTVVPLIEPPAPAPAVAPATPAVAPAVPAAPADLSALSPMADAPKWSELSTLANQLTQQEFEAAISGFYSDGSTFPQPWEVTTDGVSVKTGDIAAPIAMIPFRKPSDAKPKPQRYWRTLAELPPLRGRPVLSDLNVALDPGHIGGNYAKIEERHLSFAPGESIQEGDLSLLTAQVLKKRLEELGAVVSLVRENNEPVTTDRPGDMRLMALDILNKAGVPRPVETYDPNSGDAKVLTTQWQSEKLFYRVSEIRSRARKVNEKLKPDVVFCIHFNAESWGDATRPQFSPQNHMHVLINGCFSPLELATQDVRFEMISRVFSRAHEVELPLAEAVANSLATTTGLPPYVYTTSNARRVGTSSYVYARNLLANRLYQCPVIYLEPFVMNHEDTYGRLLLGHYRGRTLVGGKLRSSAIEEYVNGVVQGLLKYSQNKRGD